MLLSGQSQIALHRVAPVVVSLMVGLFITPAGVSATELQVAAAEGFRDTELQSGKSIAVCPISARAADVRLATHLSSMLSEQTTDDFLVKPAQVNALMQASFTASAYDSLVTALSSAQPAQSFSVLAVMSERLAASHALVPVKVASNRPENRYEFTIMFVLVDLESGSPRLIMRASDVLNGKTAAKTEEQSRLQAQTMRAVLDALRERRG